MQIQTHKARTTKHIEIELSLYYLHRFCLISSSFVNNRIKKVRNINPSRTRAPVKTGCLYGLGRNPNNNNPQCQQNHVMQNMQNFFSVTIIFESSLAPPIVKQSNYSTQNSHSSLNMSFMVLSVDVIYSSTE